MNKKELRKYALKLRKQLTYDKDLLEKEVLKHAKDCKVVAIYYPLAHEFDLTFLKKYNFDLCFPKIFGYSMEFYKNPTKFEKTVFNLNEPLDGTLVNPSEIDIMFVPCLLVNKRLYRIGYGNGYYDKYLKGNNIKTVGICYEELFLDFKEDIFDEKLGDVIICKQ